MENIHQWDRDEKLFAIQVLRDAGHLGRGKPLLRLVVSDDPVVRGKAALALRGCADDVLLEAADTLLEQRRANTSILALEILGFTRDVDYADRLGELLGDADDRVVKAAIESMGGLEPRRARPLLEEVLDRYQPDWDRALRRTLARLGDPQLLPVLKKWFRRAEPDRQPTILGLAAGMEDEDAREWVRSRTAAFEEDDPRIGVIHWVLGE